MIRMLLATGAAALLAFAAEAAPDTAPGGADGVKPPPAVASVAAEVALVRIVGPWDTAEQKGFSRLVALVRGGAPTLYVQWIATGASPADNTVVQTALVAGAEAVPTLPLAEVAVYPDRNNSEVTFALPHPRGAEGQSYVLDVGLPGDARFGPESH